jgi:hypothetical protein
MQPVAVLGAGWLDSGGRVELVQGKTATERRKLHRVAAAERSVLPFPTVGSGKNLDSMPVLGDVGCAARHREDHPVEKFVADWSDLFDGQIVFEGVAMVRQRYDHVKRQVAWPLPCDRTRLRRALTAWAVEHHRHTAVARHQAVP